MKRYLKWLVVLIGVLLVLAILIVTLGSGDMSKNRQIAQYLVQCRDSENARRSAARESITNLFHGQVIIENSLAFMNGYMEASAFVHCDYDLGFTQGFTQLREYYWINNSVTNSSEWTLHHYWYWNGHRFLRHKLVTIVETNTPSH